MKHAGLTQTLLFSPAVFSTTPIHHAVFNAWRGVLHRDAQGALGVLGYSVRRVVIFLDDIYFNCLKAGFPYVLTLVAADPRNDNKGTLIKNSVDQQDL